MIRRLGLIFVGVMAFLIFCGTIQQMDEANIPDGARYEAEVP